MTRYIFLVALTVLLFAPRFVRAAAFTDVPNGLRYAESINAMRQKGFVSGYPDGSFRPDRTLNRAEFVQLLLSQLDSKGDLCKTIERIPFSDTPKRAWYTRAVCVAKEKGIIRGFDDGTFRPGDPLTLADASVLLALTFGAERVDSQPWYKWSIEYLGERKAIAPTLGSPHQRVTRSEAIEMMLRLLDGDRTRSSPTTDAVLSSSCVESKALVLQNVDVQEATRQWLVWINSVRAEQGAPPVSLNRQLSRTASVWSSVSAERGSISHKRPGQTAYYDYPLIEDWFGQNGLTFRNVERLTFTENIGSRPFSCTARDCTDAFVRATRATFDFYLTERDKESRPHWNSIVQPRFREVGVGFALSPDGKKYYVTTHYATEITSRPEPVCP